MKAIRFGTLLAAAIVSAIVSMTAFAGVCKIDSTEYDTLQEAFDAVPARSADTTITLLKDVDVTSVIDIPRHYMKLVTLDGAGYTIRQAYAGRMFQQTHDFSSITFKNVTILGGGEECSTASTDIYGTFFHITSDSQSSLTIDAGCVISNFVMYGALIGAPSSRYPKWNIYIKPGAVIAHNRSSQEGCILFVERWVGETGLRIEGGEIFDNSAPNGAIASISAISYDNPRKLRTSPIIIISGGRIHDNTSTYLFRCRQGPMDIQITGGEIFDNNGGVFYVSYGNDYYDHIHFSGGKVFGNAGYAVYDYPDNNGRNIYLSGDAIVGGNGENGRQGTYSRINQDRVRVALEGDFTGFAQVLGSGSLSVGKVFGTNLLSCAGSRNINQGAYPSVVLETDPDTGALVWAEPSSVKIGAAEYATLAAAISAATDGATIELARDCVMTAPIVPPANKVITIDGSGHRIFRSMKDPLVKVTTAGGDMTFTNVELNEGYFTSLDSYTNHVDGVIVQTTDGVAATVTLGPGTVVSGGRGTNALVRVANGATVNLDGCVITGTVNRAVSASAGGTLGVKGATVVKDNAGGDIDVADGNILSLNGNLTGRVHVTVAGVEAYAGQRFGMRTDNWSGCENFINGGSDQKLHVSESGALFWNRRGLYLTFR